MCLGPHRLFGIAHSRFIRVGLDWSETCLQLGKAPNQVGCGLAEWCHLEIAGLSSFEKTDNRNPMVYGWKVSPISKQELANGTKMQLVTGPTSYRNPSNRCVRRADTQEKPCPRRRVLGINIQYSSSVKRSQ